MSDVYRVYGSRVEIPAREAGWKFSKRPGGWCLAERANPDGTVERRRFFMHEARGRLSASLGGRLYAGEVVSARAGQSGGGTGSDADLVAQFPGKVRKVLVAEGAGVAAGEPLVLVEAMKMEFAVKAPFGGTVRRILVKEGQQLAPGDRFVDLDAAAEGGTGGP